MSNGQLSEKVSVNMNTSTLSEIDLLVDNGYYSNRSDFINQAVRDALQKQRSVLDRIIETNREGSDKRNEWFVGLYGLEKRTLEALKKKDRKITLTGYGVLTVAQDVDDALLFDTVEAIRVRGKVICSEKVREHYHLTR